ncbi:MAG: fimbrial protein pilin [Candidatus Saccharibacteria bacterium]|nr:fimbrial protein pilin [Candidatus Saccharibacteria bacterium]
MISLNKNNKGFTIVELLIVIVVIGILALLVITTYSGIQAKARNSKRQTDLASLQTHLEAFYNENGYYPNRDDMNNLAGFVSVKLKGLDPAALHDPSNANQDSATPFVGVATAKSYAYIPLNASDAACEGVAPAHESCSQYKLTATYEGKVNGQDTVTKSSLN